MLSGAAPRILALVTALSSTVLVPPRAVAQGPDSSSVVDSTLPRVGSYAFAGWAALGMNQPLRTRLGHVHDRDLALFAGRVAFVRSAWPTVVTRFTIDVLPLMIATRNPSYDVHGACAPLETCRLSVLRAAERRSTAFGMGLTPLGVELEWIPRARVSPVASISGGGAWFDQPLPDPEANHFNFTAEGALGARVHAGVIAVTGGLRWYHISNGGTGAVNPAMDSRLLFVGLSR